MTDSAPNRRLLEAACAIARDAGRAILEVYGRTDFSVRSRATLAADRRRPGRARHHQPSARRSSTRLPVLSEESCPRHAPRRDWKRYWLVDPLDGTKEFFKRNGEFTVNIALVDEHRAVLGVVYAPALDRCTRARSRPVRGAPTRGGAAATDRVRADAASPLRVVGSRSHPTPELAAYLAGLAAARDTDMGSSLKICLVADGDADVYPRLGPTSEWDTAAAQAILESAGGRMIDLAGQPLRYNTKDSLAQPTLSGVWRPAAGLVCADPEH